MPFGLDDTEFTPATYFTMLGAYMGTLNELAGALAKVARSGETWSEPTERGLLQSLLDSTESSGQTTKLFKDAGASLGALTPVQERALEGCMDAIGALEEEIEKEVKALEVIKSKWEA